MPRISKINGLEIVDKRVDDLQSETKSLRKELDNTKALLLETVVAEAEETYNDVDVMTTPSSVTIGSTSYPVIDNSRMVLNEVLGKTIVNDNALIDSKFIGIKSVGKNLFNGEWEQGTLDVWSGVEVASTTRIRTGFIDVSNLTKLYWFANISIANAVAYDANYNWVAGSLYTNGVSIPANTKYVRYIFRYSDDRTITPNDENLQFILSANNQTVSTYVPYINPSQIIFVPQTLRGIGTAKDKLVITKNTDNDLYTMKKIAYCGSYVFTGLEAGSSSNGAYPSNSFYVVIPTIDAKINIYATNKTLFKSDNNINTYYVYFSSNTALRFATSASYSSFAEAKEANLVNNAIVYELAEPVETILYNDLTYSQVSFITQQGGTISTLSNSLAKGDLTLLETIKYFRSN